MSKKIEVLIEEGMRKAYKDGYRQGFRDGYNEVYAEQLEQPTPKSSGKLSIKTDKFKCTGCSGTWASSEDAKHHACKDHQQTS
jgi:hypothetical protein